MYNTFGYAEKYIKIKSKVYCLSSYMDVQINSKLNVPIFLFNSLLIAFNLFHETLCECVTTNWTTSTNALFPKPVKFIRLRVRNQEYED